MASKRQLKQLQKEFTKEMDAHFNAVDDLKAAIKSDPELNQSDVADRIVREAFACLQAMDKYEATLSPEARQEFDRYMSTSRQHLKRTAIDYGGSASGYPYGDPPT